MGELEEAVEEAAPLVGVVSGEAVEGVEGVVHVDSAHNLQSSSKPAVMPPWIQEESSAAFVRGPGGIEMIPHGVPAEPPGPLAEKVKQKHFQKQNKARIARSPFKKTFNKTNCSKKGRARFALDVGAVDQYDLAGSDDDGARFCLFTTGSDRCLEEQPVLDSSRVTTRILNYSRQELRLLRTVMKV